MANENRSVWVQTGENGRTLCLLPEVGQGGWRYSLPMLDAIAREGGSVLVTGETGTGKELLARYLHDRSRRANGPYVTVNCTGLTEERMQGELFGWEKGAFTGADKAYDGLILRAEGGTVFLDEIGNMDRQNQGRLLRFLQTGEVQPLGKPVQHADVRVIAATNRPVDPTIGSQALIPDLFHRFRFSDLILPRLVDRGFDFFHLLLGDEFLGTAGRFNAITLGTLARLVAYRWPGNIRELQRYCRNARLLAGFEKHSPRLPPTVLHMDSPFGPDAESYYAEAIDEQIQRYASRMGTPGDKTLRFLGLCRWGLGRRELCDDDFVPLHWLKSAVDGQWTGEPRFDMRRVHTMYEVSPDGCLGKVVPEILSLPEVLIELRRMIGSYHEERGEDLDEDRDRPPPVPWSKLAALPSIRGWDELPSAGTPPLEAGDPLSSLRVHPRCKYPLHVIIEVLGLYREGRSRREIAGSIPGSMTPGQVGHVTRTYGDPFRPRRRNTGGRPRKAAAGPGS